MVIISLMILIIAIALTSVGTSKKTISLSLPIIGDMEAEGISPILFTRLTSIIFIFSGVLSYNALYIQEIGSGIGIYSGFFQVTAFSQYIDIFILLVAFT